MNLFSALLTTTTNKLMDGVLILETEELFRESFPWVIAFSTLALLFLIVSIASISSDYDWYGRMSVPSFICSLFTVCFIVLDVLFIASLFEETPVLQHTVYIEDSSAIPELYENYEIISHETNEVWIVREKK